MEGKESIEFNTRRAEGTDKSKPKTLQLKTRKLNPSSTSCYVQILGTGMDTQDTVPSILLFFDKQRFIVNAGEGLQRFCTEHKVKLSKIDHMFLTRVCSETTGGLPGMLLTLAGMGDKGMTVNIWGPSDLKYLVDAMRSFIPNSAMAHTHSFGSAPRGSDAGIFTDPMVLIDDEVVKISAILLRPSYSNMLNLAAVRSEGNREQLSEPVASSLQSSPRKEGTVLKPGDISVIYICELPEIQGKFDPTKAVALGLKAGPKYRELQLGNPVMSDHQSIMVHPSDVLGPSSPGPIVLLVDCPTLSHVEEMLSIQTLSDFYVENLGHHQEGMKYVNCVIHLGPTSVTMAPNYQKWMKRFGVAQHIMAGHEMKNMEIPILKSSARIASRLNYLCPQFFPGPDFWSLGHLNQIAQSSAASSEGSSLMLCESIHAENLLKFQLRPYAQLGLDRSGVPNLVSRTEIINELLAEIPEIEDASIHISQFWDSSRKPIGMASPAQDNLILIKEPLVNGNACISNAYLSNQVTVAYEETTTSNDCSTTDFKHEPELPSCLENISREDMEIVLLGTGSSQPSKYRNVSSIYINLFSKGSLLLDCGEGTLAQLKRRFGLKGADDAIRGLRCVWISHIHADHHTGLARILSWRCELLRCIPHEPLLVIGPRQLKRFLDAYSRLEDLDMLFLDCSHTTEASMDALAGSLDSDSDYIPSASTANDGNVNRIGGRVGGPGLFSAQKHEMTLFEKGSGMQSHWKRPGSPVESAVDLLALMKLKKVLLEAGLEALISVPVVHCPQAFGVVLQAAERMNNVEKAIPGWKLVYSGDTRPCPALVDASHGATVLIHEATFEDGMGEEAVARNHSMTKEAIEVGASAGVYRIILTHFSQRYPKIPVFDATHMDKTCIAFDMMSINVAELPILPKVVPYLTLLFRNEMVVDESDDIPVSTQDP